jgi:phenylacetate-coenzyme A ligase PaaK-like adenylate-forming protein
MTILQILRLLSLRRQLHRHDFWQRSVLERHQKEALARLREFACARSPFYKTFHAGLAGQPLDKLPVLTKELLMRHWDEIVTDRTLKLSEVQQFISRNTEQLLFKGTYYCAATSGATGVRGVFAYNRDEWLRVLASYARANDWAEVKAGLTRPLKLAVVSTRTPWHQSALVGKTLQSRFVPTLRLDSTEPIPSIVSRLNAFQPRLLVAYANMARTLAQEQRSGALSIHPEAVFCASEVLTRDSRRLMQQAWGVNPFNVYAATETADIASECTKHQGLHLYDSRKFQRPPGGPIVAIDGLHQEHHSSIADVRPEMPADVTDAPELAPAQ